MTCLLCYLLLCVILSNSCIHSCCKTFGGHTKYLDVLLQGVRCSDAAAAQAKAWGDLWAREEGAAGKSRGAKIIQET